MLVRMLVIPQSLGELRAGDERGDNHDCQREQFDERMAGDGQTASQVIQRGMLIISTNKPF